MVLSSPRRLLAALVLPAALLGPITGSASAETENRAAALRQGGSALTNYDLTKLVAGGSFTLTARYMPKYRYMHAGAVLGSRSSSRMFQVGVADFRIFQPGNDFEKYGTTGRLQVRIGDRQLVYVTDSDKGGAPIWSHLALVVRRLPGADPTISFYVNGMIRVARGCFVHTADPTADPPIEPTVCPGFTQAIEVSVPAAQFQGIGGGLMLGQTGGGTAVPVQPVTELQRIEPRRIEAYSSPSDDQFYGLIDDVGAFGSALSSERIAKLAKARRLTGYEQGLRVGFNFDVGDPSHTKGVKPRLGAAKFVPGRSGLLKVGKSRFPGADTILALGKIRAVQTVPWTLPFDRGQEWLVQWGNHTAKSSHNGSASFAWDFVLADKPNPETCGTNLRAPAPGSATAVDDDGFGNRPDLHPDATNELTGQVRPRELFGFLHIQTNSVRQTFTTATVPPAVPFKRGQVIARTGNRNLDFSNCHLHMSSKAGGGVTTPAEFSNYEVRDPKTGEWKFLSVGVPRTGQFIRVPPVG